jgi:hypothetical protein
MKFIDLGDRVTYEGGSISSGEGNIQNSHLHIDGAWCLVEHTVFPRFYGEGGILECALLRKPRPETIEYWITHKTFQTKKEGEDYFSGLGYKHFKIFENVYGEGYYSIIEDEEEAVRFALYSLPELKELNKAS